ncbi:3-phosphoshikimate 1-carboxyvinyltransferase [Wenzhouxiangella sp. XN79A]|uniref:3-phosphoshikimate 1-carboxyvinyltransferase n=1 Tax=Wenzhouxiangella sp. XN79A TaxID=2724193 RepID=UPI00144A5072|nr:3-phosphoshikimate 1-carboxyvinyltransferase [Wenzhouxiangella sp. XN79A]NKI35533.1 3-phosphoshikimate 1-carboxyvinyltransferase [Wenzhouxiangella sp. XN79A]
MRLRVHPARSPLAGTIRAPGDKSISHRAVLFGGLAEGTTEVSGFLEGEDTRATLAAMEALGARVERDGATLRVHGGGLQAPPEALDLGNAGTGIRLLAGALVGHPDLHGGVVTLTGDASLSRRPMDRIIEPLARMGARIESREGRAPLVLHPGPLRPVDLELSIASAQVKSAVLLAGMNAPGTTRITLPAPSRDHTERLLPAFGVAVRVDGLSVEIDGPVRLGGARVAVPGDLSSATFALAAALLVPGSEVRIAGVGINPTRDGVLRIVERMAPGSVDRRAAADGDAAGDEPVADLVVHHAGRPVGIEVPVEWVPLAIDEFPMLMALAAASDGVTEIRGAEELRVKESDRIAVMTEQLRRLGVAIDERPDGARIVGGGVAGGRVDAGGDHRVAMSLAVLALVADGPVEIDGADWIATSYPGFVDDLRTLGADVEEQQ